MPYKYKHIQSTFSTKGLTNGKNLLSTNFHPRKLKSKIKRVGESGNPEGAEDCAGLKPPKMPGSKCFLSLACIPHLNLPYVQCYNWSPAGSSTSRATPLTSHEV